MDKPCDNCFRSDKMGECQYRYFQKECEYNNSYSNYKQLTPIQRFCRKHIYIASFLCTLMVLVVAILVIAYPEWTSAGCFFLGLISLIFLFIKKAIEFVIGF